MWPNFRAFLLGSWLLFMPSARQLNFPVLLCPTQPFDIKMSKGKGIYFMMLSPLPFLFNLPLRGTTTTYWSHFSNVFCCHYPQMNRQTNRLIYYRT